MHLVDWRRHLAATNLDYDEPALLSAAGLAGERPLNPWLSDRTLNLVSSVDEAEIDQDTSTSFELQGCARAQSALVSDDLYRNGTGSVERLLDFCHVSYPRNL